MTDSDGEDGTEDRNDLTQTESIARHYSALSGLSQPTLWVFMGAEQVEDIICTQE